ncbi:hypothetical protein QU487_06775 [Crenobacter sp. SG2305]|uniref:hypothetical protein n=1 Tax=Crenobacter oryzisoli TaxID=3056844 RepID=UPI0025AAD093|nr:hypothetical protein [Crenobacter sp. SG2305]MDN0082458.1 hypothetical protein [Crenobacter sp. SG2305]
MRQTCDLCHAPSESVISYRSLRITHDFVVCGKRQCHDWAHNGIDRFEEMTPPFYRAQQAAVVEETRMSSWPQRLSGMLGLIAEPA